jgi:hypothetical protein
MPVLMLHLSQKHTAGHRYLYTTSQPISVHNSSMNITKTPIGSRAAWRQLPANSIKIRPASPTDTRHEKEKMSKKDTWQVVGQHQHWMLNFGENCKR